MSQDLRFIDPAFTCEVVLTGVIRALYDAAKPQFERLEGVRSLGLIAHTERVAKHTRHQHVVGLMRIFNKLCQQPNTRGLPKQFLWSFWCRLCFAQTGHAALSYDSEKAVMLACHLDTGFKDKLRDLLRPVITSLAACGMCKRPCDVAMKGNVEAEAWFEDLINKNRWQQLHLWVASLKLLQHPKLLGILGQQTFSKDNTIGFFQAEALKMLVAPGCAWDTPVRRLSRLDFIPRDLAFAGTVGITLDVDALVAAANSEHPDWKLLGSLSNYMSENIYENLPQQAASVLFQRALAALLLKGKVSLEQLFGMDPATALDDDQLRDIVAKTPAGKQVFDDTVRESWQVWPVQTLIDTKSLPCEIEREITGHAKGHLERHVAAKVSCFKLSARNTLALAMSHRSLAEKPDAKAFVKLCRSVLLKQLPKINAEALADALYEGLVESKCRHGLEAAVSKLARLGLPVESLKKSAELVNARATKGSAADGEMRIQVGGFSYTMPGDPQEFQVNAMHAAISGDDGVRKNLGMSLEDASETLWNELLRWQSLYFGLNPAKTLTALLDSAQSALAKLVAVRGQAADAALEVYTLLEALKHPAESVSFRIALPNLILLREDKNKENEYDVVSVILKEDKHVEVWVWGVTTEQNLTKKRQEDLGKIEKLKDILGNRWEDDVRTVTCYVHRDGNDICLDIGGKKTKRPITP